MHGEPVESSALLVRKPLGRRWVHTILGFGITAACLWFIAARVDPQALVRALADFQLQYLLVALASLSFGYAMRIVRWSTLLRAAEVDVSASRCIAPFLGSIALNNVLPMRLGDVVRALIFPRALGISKVTATGSLVMERLVDLMTLLMCLMIGLAWAPRTALPGWLGELAVSLSIAGAASLVMLFLVSAHLSSWLSRISAGAWFDTRVGIRRIVESVSGLLASFDAMSRPRVLGALFGLSFLVWAGEAGLFWAMLAGFGLPAGPETAVIVMAIATLSTMVPSSPGYVGPFHVAAYTGVSMLGGTASQAAAFAVASHLAVWLPTTLAGAIAILANPHLFSSIKKQEQTATLHG